MKLDAATYKAVRALPEAVACRVAAQAWIDAADADGLDHSPGCKHERAAERAHRHFLDAAATFGAMIAARGGAT